MTVIIPAYNCSHILPRALNSLVKQSDKDFSVVLVDDCSTEDLSIIVNQYKDRLNITHIYTSENQGCGGARQRGIEYIGTNDDYITFLDADDVLIPCAIKVWKKAAEMNPDIIYTPFLTYNLYQALFLTNMFVGSSGTYMMHGKVYKTSFLQKNNIYSDYRLRYFYNDYFFNHQALNFTHNIVYVEQICYIYIKTPNSATTTLSYRQQYQQKMQILAKQQLALIFKEKNIQKETIYWLNEKSMIYLFLKMKNQIYQNYERFLNN